MHACTRDIQKKYVYVLIELVRVYRVVKIGGGERARERERERERERDF